MTEEPDYHYEHVNGSIIDKPARVVNAAGGPSQYFTGPFVKRWWQGDDPEKPAAEPLYHVWSNEHRAWWRPNRCGYTHEIEAAGIYPRSEALAICRNARDGWRPGENPTEIAVLASDGIEAIGGRAC